MPHCGTGCLDVVVAQLNADRVLHFAVAPPIDAPIAHLAAGDEPVIRLVKLIAVHRIVEEEREVREQVEAVRSEIAEDLELALLGRSRLVLELDLMACSVAAFVGIDRAKA